MAYCRGNLMPIIIDTYKHRLYFLWKTCGKIVQKPPMTIVHPVPLNVHNSGNHVETLIHSFPHTSRSYPHTKAPLAG